MSIQIFPSNDKTNGTDFQVVCLEIRVLHTNDIPGAEMTLSSPELHRDRFQAWCFFVFLNNYRVAIFTSNPPKVKVEVYMTGREAFRHGAFKEKPALLTVALDFII